LSDGGAENAKFQSLTFLNIPSFHLNSSTTSRDFLSFFFAF